MKNNKKIIRFNNLNERAFMANERERLIKIRTFLGLNQLSWGKFLSKGLTTISQWELGVRNPKRMSDIRVRLYDAGINDQYLDGKPEILRKGFSYDKVVKNVADRIKKLEVSA